MNNKSPFLKSTMTNGLIMGFALVVLSLIVYLLGLGINSKLNWISYLIIIGMLIYAQKQFRTEQGGFASYWQLVGYGTLMAVFAGFISGIWNIILMTVIDPGLWEQTMIEAQNVYLEMGFSEDQVEEMMVNAEKYSSPLITSISMAFGFGLMGFIFSLIISAFLKKENESFDMAMDKIEDNDEK